MLLHLWLYTATFVSQSESPVQPSIYRVSIKFRQGLKSLTAILLLTAYIVGASGFARLHTAFHEHEELHTQVHEADPCHRAIYHHDATGACHHDAHLIASDNCDLCKHLVFYKDQLYASFANASDFSFPLAVALTDMAAVIFSETSNLSSRAPPAFHC